jgi:hypothetical protein
VHAASIRISTIRSSSILVIVAALAFVFLPRPAEAAPLIASGATNVGFCGGDDWEPEIAAHAGYVYVGIAHFPGDPTCSPASADPRDIYVRTSADDGQTFGPLVALPDRGYPSVVDVVVTVDDVTEAVYVSYLAYGLTADTAILVAKSTDHGSTWTATRANNPDCPLCDHPWIVAHDDHVYVSFASGDEHFVSRSDDGGATWQERMVLEDTHVAFPEGGVVDAAGNAWFAWGDCYGSCTGKTAAVYRVSRTKAGTLRTRFAAVAEGTAGPHCPPSVSCGFAYWGPQDDIAIDASGNLYLVWQDALPHKPGRPPIVRLSSCSAGDDCTRASSWRRVGRVDDKTATGCAGGQCYALYPRIEGGSAGKIGVIWMDDRLGAPLDHNNGWNVWYRTSKNGGLTWGGPSVRVSQYDPTRSESHPNGFEFPYGDYQGIDLLGNVAVMAWGEGHNYVGGPTNPGHVIYRAMST